MSTLNFIRSYLLIVLLILLVGMGLDKLLIQFSEEESRVDHYHLNGSFLYINTQLDPQNIALSWQKNQQGIQAALGFPVILYQLNDFSDAGQFVSEKTSVMSDEAGLVYYQKLANSDFIIALGPIPIEEKSTLIGNGLIAMYYFLIAFALFIWLKPLSDDLHQLRNAAVDFGKDDFSTRVNLRKSSNIGLVADSFNTMAQRIQELVLAHQDLTHGVSHELKTPLARFKFSLAIINDLDDAVQIKRYLQPMKEDVRELDDLIDEMLNYAKFSARNLTLNVESLNAIQWLEAVIKLYARESIIIKLVIDPRFLATKQAIIIDRHLMSRVMHNLIRNGLRYAENQLVITLMGDKQHFILWVDDDGQGIPEQCLEQVFQPFSRLDTSRDKQSGGHGLGLAICQKIVQQHKGTIVAETLPFGGARFHLCMERLL